MKRPLVAVLPGVRPSGSFLGYASGTASHGVRPRSRRLSIEALEHRTLLSATPAEIAAALDLAPGVTVGYSGDARAVQARTVAPGTGLFGFPMGAESDYLMLSTGVASDLDTKTYDPGVGIELGTDLGPAGNAGDTASISFSLPVPQSTTEQTLKFDFLFMSEEYPDYVGREFNDSFSAKINGTEVAYDQYGNRTDVNHARFIPIPSNAGMFFSGHGRITQTTAAYSIPAGVTQLNVALTIGDASNGVYDSAVLLDNFRIEGGSGGPTLPELIVSALDLPAGTAVNYTGDPLAVALRTLAPLASLFEFPSGAEASFVMLSTGVADQIDRLANTAGDQGTDLGAEGVAGDSATISFALPVPQSVLPQTLKFDFAFMSEEYPEWVGKYNDSFSAKVNGTEIAYDPSGNRVDVNHAPFDKTLSTAGTFFDGRTARLTARYDVPAGVTVLEVSLSISDALNGGYDSAVFLDHFRFEPNTTFLDMATALDLPVGIAVNYTGDPLAVALRTLAPPASLFGFPSGSDSSFVMLSTGVANQIDRLANTAGDQGTDLGAGGVAGDSVTISFALPVPQSALPQTLNFDFAFTSEEYPEWVGKYNDSFSAMVNGTEIAYDPSGNRVDVNDAPFDQALSTAGTFFDGRTARLTARYDVPAGVTVLNVSLSISDALNGDYDSAVFLDHFRFESSEPVPVHLTGTPGDDSFSFSTEGTDYLVTVNGVRSTWPMRQVSEILLDGLGGSDQASVRGASGDLTAASNGSAITVSRTGYKLTMTSVEQIAVEAGPGGNPSATLYDGPGNDTFTGAKGSGALQYATGSTLTVSGFRNVYAYAIYRPGDTGDKADLYDAAASIDQYLANPALARFSYDYLNPGGPAGQTMATGFNQVVAHTDPQSAEVDVAQYYDSATANDTFASDAAARTSSMTDGASYHHGGQGFKKIYAWSSGGTDLADISGTTGADTIVAALRPLAGSSTSTNYGYLLASTGQTFAYNFAHLKVDAIQGAMEKAHILDSSESDLLTIGPTKATLASQAASGTMAGRWIEVNNVSAVYATGGAGTARDAATLADSAGNDIFWAQPKDAHIAYGAGPFVDLKGFAEVTAVGGSGTAMDTAYLHDSAIAGANDMLVAGARSATMRDAGGTYSVAATGFGSLLAYSRSGQDAATLHGSAGNDVLTVVPGGYAGSTGQASATYRFDSVLTAGSQAVAFGFRYVEADGGPGGAADIAYLHDSPGNDIARLSQASQTIETTGNDAHVYARAAGFDQVYAKSYGAGKDTAYLRDTSNNDFFRGYEKRSYFVYGGAAGQVYADAFETVDATFSQGDETAWLERTDTTGFNVVLRNTNANDAILEDQATGGSLFRIWLHSLDAGSDRVSGYLRLPDISTVDPAAVAYLLALKQPWDGSSR